MARINKNKMVSSAFIKLTEFDSTAINLIMAKRKAEGCENVSKAAVLRDGLQPLLEAEGFKIADVKAAIKASKQT